MFFHYNVGDHKGGICAPSVTSVNAAQFANSHPPLADGVDNNDEEARSLPSHLFVRAATSRPSSSWSRREGIKVYGYGKQAYELLLGYILDPEYGDITDPWRVPISPYLHQAHIPGCISSNKP